MDWSNKHILELLQKNKFKTVKVVFGRRRHFSDIQKEYTYKTDIDNILINDLVIVHANNEFKIVRVTDISDDDSFIDYYGDIEYKWIVCKLPSKEYFERIDREKVLKSEINQFVKNKQRQSAITDIAINGGKKILMDEFGIDVNFEQQECDDNIEKPPIKMG